MLLKNDVIERLTVRLDLDINWSRSYMLIAMMAALAEIWDCLNERNEHSFNWNLHI